MSKLGATLTLWTVCLAGTTGLAGTKEELVRLQSDVLALQNQIRLLEKTFREQTDGLSSLVAQLNDQIGKTNQLLTKVSSSMEAQSAGERSSNQTVIQEIRNLAGKLDDTATRVSALAEQVSELKVQAKPITTRTFQSPPSDPASLSLSADAIYNEAFNDLVQGNFDMAIEGFTSYLKHFPNSEKADDAQYSIGEAHYNAGRLPQAIGAFTRVINDYPSGGKVSSSLFKRAKAEIAINERENAIADLKTIVEKYATAPESTLAKVELDNLGVKPAPKPTSKSQSRRKPRD